LRIWARSWIGLTKRAAEKPS